MASTLTPNLSLEKPAHGERVNDWDIVLNANFDVIDGAFWRLPVRTADPAAPREGEMWLRSDVQQFRIRMGQSTYKISLTVA
jgi:hypothetical protein